MDAACIAEYWRMVGEGLIDCPKSRTDGTKKVTKLRPLRLVD
jgi:hypothetical protein